MRAKVEGNLKVEAFPLENPEVRPLQGRADLQRQGRSQDEESHGEGFMVGWKGPGPRHWTGGTQVHVHHLLLCPRGKLRPLAEFRFPRLQKVCNNIYHLQLFRGSDDVSSVPSRDQGGVRGSQSAGLPFSFIPETSKASAAAGPCDCSPSSCVLLALMKSFLALQTAGQG